MSLLDRLGTSAVVYIIANALPRGIGFLLLPLYTRFLTPDHYGIVSVVTALSGMLAVVFSLSTHSAAVRFYFDLRSDPVNLARMWGTVVTFMLITSACGALGLLVAGKPALGFVLGEISFWPYAVLGILAAAFQPTIQAYLSILQVKERVRSYALVSVAQAILTMVAITGAVLGIGLGAEGVLGATAVVGALFFLYALVRLGADLRYGIARTSLGTALTYSLPLVPHVLAGQLVSVSDRLILNHYAGAAAAGLYSLAWMLSATLLIVADSINRAYVPVAMDIYTSREASKLHELSEGGRWLIGGYCLAALALALTAEELVALVAGPAYREAWRVVPLIAFGFALTGIYYVFVNILFYETAMTPFIALATISGAVIGVTTNLLLAPALGMTGAATASLLGQLMITCVTGWIGRTRDPIAWPYVRIALAWIIAALLGIFASGSIGPSIGVIGRLLAFAVAFLTVNQLLFRAPLHMFSSARAHLRQRRGR